MCKPPNDLALRPMFRFFNQFCWNLLDILGSSVDALGRRVSAVRGGVVGKTCNNLSQNEQLWSLQTLQTAYKSVSR